MQAQVEAQLNHGHGTAVNYGYSGEGMAIHLTTPSQNFDSKQSNQPEQLYRSYAPPLESLPDVNTYSQGNQLSSLTKSKHRHPYLCCASCTSDPLVIDPIVSPPAPALRRTTRLTGKSLPRFDPTLQYRTMAEPAWSNPPALTVPTPRYPTVQEPTVRVTSRNHLPLAHVHARHAQHQSDYQTHTPSSHHSLVWRTHHSVSPRPLMPLTPLPIKRPTGKKPPLACFFCRGRKIACGPPIPGSKDKTCK